VTPAAARQPDPPRADAAAWARAAEQDADAELWRAHAAHPGPATRERLVMRYLPLARSIAWRTLRRHGVVYVDMDDVQQAACEGLIQAVDRFEPGRGHRFAAFAGFRIEGAVLNSLATHSEVQQQIAARVRVRRDRLDSLRPAAPDGGAAQATPATAVETLASVSMGLALGFMLEGTGLYDDPEQPAAGSPCAYESLAWRQAQQALRDTVRTLRDDERRVLEYHYFQGLSFEQVSRLLDLSPGRISQLHRQALERLRERVAQTPATHAAW
jgi:RNA polymerase sigma factor for flagellar operon FliA